MESIAKQVLAHRFGHLENSQCRSYTFCLRWSYRQIPQIRTSVSSVRNVAMKSERPQIQESNLLADKVESFLVKVRDRLPAILAAIVISIVAMVAWGVYKSVQSSQAAAAWNAFYFSDTDSEDLDSISADFANTNASRWAQIASGDAHLAKGNENVFMNRDIADQHYEKAVASYEAITSKDQGRLEDSFVMTRGYYGLAQAYEGLARREDAIKAYRKISEQRDLAPGLNAVVASRADWLESKDGEEFTAWFKANRQAAPTIAPMGDRPLLPNAPTFDFSNLSPNSQSQVSTPEVNVEPSANAEGQSPTDIDGENSAAVPAEVETSTNADTTSAEQK